MSSPVGIHTAMAAGDMIGVIAHELRQPLSTIESIAYYLTLVLPQDDPKVHEQLNRIQQLVEQSNWILTTGQQLTEPLPCARERIDLEEVIAQAVSERFSDYDPPLLLEIAPGVSRITGDPGLIRALIGNLITLFRQLATVDHPATLETCAVENAVRVALTTSVPGHRSEAALGLGTALSLESARRMVNAERGTFHLQIDPESGIRLTVTLLQ